MESNRDSRRWTCEIALVHIPRKIPDKFDKSGRNSWEVVGYHMMHPMLNSASARSEIDTVRRPDGFGGKGSPCMMTPTHYRSLLRRP